MMRHGLTLALGAGLWLVAAGTAGAQWLFDWRAPPPPRIIDRPAPWIFDERYPFLEEQYRRQQRNLQLERQRRQAEAEAMAPPATPPNPNATTHVVVIGDSIADWVAFGLQEAFAEQPEIAVVRRIRPTGGLVRTDGYDAVATARSIDRADVVVVLYGVADRQPFRAAAPARPATPPARSPGRPGGAQQGAPAPQAAAPPPRPPEPTQAESGIGQEAETAAQAGGPPVAAEFMTPRWDELYAARVDALIEALRQRGAHVVWVGVPPIRGARSMSEVARINEVVRARTERAGVAYVDLWEAFTDEQGQFVSHGPDIAGQIRRLRAQDGAHFTRPGARKAAHYAEREILRWLGVRGAPVALPAPGTELPAGAPVPFAVPAAPATPVAPPRPVAGPVVPLTAASSRATELAGDARARNATPESASIRILQRGDAVPAVPGRADDFRWPRD